MKTKKLGLFALLATGLIALAWCNNTVEVSPNTEAEIDLWESTVYSMEDRQAAIDAIEDVFNNVWEVKPELHKIYYTSDEESAEELSYVQEYNENYTESILFKSDFHSPISSEEAGAFNPDEEYTWWMWILAREEWWEWDVVSRWY